jgi:hypothetical protein
MKRKRTRLRTRTGFLSPLLAALVTLVLFLLIRTFVLRRANSTKIAFWTLPVLLLLTFFINLFFILVCAHVVCWVLCAVCCVLCAGCWVLVLAAGCWVLAGGRCVLC